MDKKRIETRINELRAAQVQEKRTIERLQQNSLIRAGRIAELEELLKESEAEDG